MLSRAKYVEYLSIYAIVKKEEINMPNFNELYPDTEEWGMADFKGLTLVKEEWAHQCICGAKTKWHEFDTGEPLCSEECAERFAQVKKHVLMTLKRFKELISEAEYISSDIKDEIISETRKLKEEIISEVFHSECPSCILCLTAKAYEAYVCSDCRSIELAKTGVPQQCSNCGSKNLRLLGG